MDWQWPPGLHRAWPPAADWDQGHPPRAVAEALDMGPLLGLSFSRVNPALLTVGLRGSASLWHRVAPGGTGRFAQGGSGLPAAAILSTPPVCRRLRGRCSFLSAAHEAAPHSLCMRSGSRRCQRPLQARSSPGGEQDSVSLLPRRRWARTGGERHHAAPERRTRPSGGAGPPLHGAD